MTHSTKTIIAIDDDPDILDLIEFEVNKSSYHLIRAKNGSEAIDRLKTHPNPALIILDINMPLMNGHEVLDQLRVGGLLSDMPILILSANPYDVQMDDASLFLAKPFQLWELRAALNTLLKSSNFQALEHP
jgi:CheY-like chemotaxis protein